MFDFSYSVLDLISARGRGGLARLRADAGA